MPDPFSLDSQPVDERTLDELTRPATFGADAVMMFDASPWPGTPAKQTEVCVRAALYVLLANGLIQATDETLWPEWLITHPPHEWIAAQRETARAELGRLTQALYEHQQGQA